jgi:hypothetical protein
MTALFSMVLLSPQLNDERRFATMAGPAKTRKSADHDQCHPGPADPVEGREEASHHEGDAKEGGRKGAPERGQNARRDGFGLGEDHLRECWLGLRQKKVQRVRPRRATFWLRIG